MERAPCCGACPSLKLARTSEGLCSSGSSGICSIKTTQVTTDHKPDTLLDKLLVAWPGERCAAICVYL
ncbi:hypothetical protein WJX79_010915 [Trebouxia sp. C0005]